MRSQIVPRAIDFRVKEFYRILFDDEHLPIEIDKDITDEKLADFLTHLKEVQKDIEEIYDYHYELYRLLFRESYNSFEVDDGRSWRLNDVVDTTKELMENLGHQDDEIRPVEDSMLLCDLGFRDVPWGCLKNEKYFEKIIEDNDEREIIEEIILLEDSVLHRKRTTTWISSSGCKSSDTITYEDLEITPEIEKAIENERGR